MEAKYYAEPYKAWDGEIRYKIYKDEEGERMFMFGNLTESQAQMYLDCPEEIEKEYNFLKHSFYAIVVCVVVIIIWFCL